MINIDNKTTNKKLPKWHKVFVFILLVALYGSFMVYKITLPAAQDLPRQMQNGEDVLHGNFDVLTKNVYSYTEPDQPFANHHWLYGVFAYLLNQAVGWNGMVVFKILFLLSTFALLFHTSLKKSNFWIVALFSIPAILVLASRTALRPEIFSYFFVVLFLYLLSDLEKNPESKKIFWLIPAQLVWVNTHLFFPIGILLVAGFLFEKIIFKLRKLKENKIVKKLSLLLLALVAVVFLNPYGLKGAIYSLWVNSYTDFPIHSAEINSISNVLHSEPGWSNISGIVFVYVASGLFLSFIVAFVFRWKKKELLFSNNFIFYFMASVGSGVLGYFVIRGLPLFGLIFLPAIINNLNGPYVALVEWMQKRWPQIKTHVGAPSFFWGTALTFIIIGLIIFSQKMVMRFTEQGVGLARYAETSANFFKDNNLKGPIFNDTDIGSYLIGHLYPQEKVFVDNRFGDAYSASFFKDIFLPLVQNEEKWKEGLEKYKFNTIFFYQYDGVSGARDFLYNRIYDEDWAWVYADSYVVILVRNTQENKEVIDKFKITSENMKERLRYLADEGDEISVADLFNLIGRFDLSTPLYLKSVSLNPERGKVWMVLGRAELMNKDLENSDPYLAAVFLERAVKEGWKTWESYSFLALAYYRTRQIDKAKWAVGEELKIDPENEDGLKWLGILANEIDEKEVRKQELEN